MSTQTSGFSTKKQKGETLNSYLSQLGNENIVLHQICISHLGNIAFTHLLKNNTQFKQEIQSILDVQKELSKKIYKDKLPSHIPSPVQCRWVYIQRILKYIINNYQLILSFGNKEINNKIKNVKLLYDLLCPLELFIQIASGDHISIESIFPLAIQVFECFDSLYTQQEYKSKYWADIIQNLENELYTLLFNSKYTEQLIVAYSMSPCGSECMKRNDLLLEGELLLDSKQYFPNLLTIPQISCSSSTSQTVQQQSTSNSSIQSYYLQNQQNSEQQLQQSAAIEAQSNKNQKPEEQFNRIQNKFMQITSQKLEIPPPQLENNNYQTSILNQQKTHIILQQNQSLTDQNQQVNQKNQFQSEKSTELSSKSSNTSISNNISQQQNLTQDNDPEQLKIQQELQQLLEEQNLELENAANNVDLQEQVENDRKEIIEESELLKQTLIEPPKQKAKYPSSIWSKMIKLNWCEIARQGFISQAEILLPNVKGDQNIKMKARLEEIWAGKALYVQYRCQFIERVSFWSQFTSRTDGLQNLQKIAIKYLSCAASEASCERFFSLMKWRLGKLRNSLSDVNLLSELQIDYSPLL